MSHKRSIPRIFAVPAALTVLSLIGLIAGLTGDGLPDWIGWLLVSLPLLVVVRAWLRRDRTLARRKPQ